jgi:hypothetical protein
MAIQIQLRRGLLAEWKSANSVLAEGEIGLEKDTGNFKIGNGSTAWSDLTYPLLYSSNNALYLNGIAAASYVQNTDSRTLSGNLYFTASNNYFNSSVKVGANVTVNNTNYFVGNSTVNTNITAGSISISGATVNSTFFQGTANNANNLGSVAAANFVQNTDSRTLSGNLYFTGSNNFFLSSLYVGSNVTVNTSSHYVGNTTVNTNITAGSISISGIVINSTTYGGSANNASYLGGTLAASYVQNTDSRTLSGNLNFTGANSTFTGKVTYSANIILNTGVNIIDSTGSSGSANQVLTSNGTGNVYWSAAGWGGGELSNTAYFSNTAPSTNATSGAVTIVGGLGVANNIYTAGRFGFSNSTNISVAYTVYNQTLNTIDTVFG